MRTRLSTPRIPPLAKEDWDEQVQAILRPLVDAGTVYNIFTTLAHHPALLRRWLAFAKHVRCKLEHLYGAGRGPGSGGPRSLFSRPFVLALLLWLGPSAGQADECGPLCDRDFWRSATPEDVKTLLATGLNVNARDETGTPLHRAAAFSTTPEVVRALVAAGAAVNARTENGWTPLHGAAAGSTTPGVLAIVLDAGADPTAKTSDGRTAFDLLQSNSTLKGTQVYWRLNDLQYE